MVNESDTKWTIERDSSKLWATAFTYYKGNNLDSLAKQIGLDKEDAANWLKDKDNNPVDLNKVGAEKIYRVPNTWITANLMQGGDIIDSVINLGGTLGAAFNSHKPSGAYEVSVDNIKNLTSVIADHVHYIYGMIIYAHGNPLGYIYSSANHSWGAPDRIHTLDVLTTLSFANYKLAYAYPMYCYSAYKGSGDKEYRGNDKEKNERRRDEFVKKYKNTTKRDPDVYNGAPGMRSVTYNNLDWLIQWQRRAIVVEGYTGMNVLGLDI